MGRETALMHSSSTFLSVEGKRSAGLLALRFLALVRRNTPCADVARRIRESILAMPFFDIDFRTALRCFLIRIRHEAYDRYRNKYHNCHSYKCHGAAPFRKNSIFHNSQTGSDGIEIAESLWDKKASKKSVHKSDNEHRIVSVDFSESPDNKRQDGYKNKDSDTKNLQKRF